MGMIDKRKFEQVGGVGCSNSDYHLRRTTCCGSYGVEDAELSDLYIDPGDLSKRLSLLVVDSSPMPCPFCGSLDWDTNDVLELIDIPPAWRRWCSEY